MFGEKMDSYITMLQRIVALVRDLVIAVVAILTSVIVYFKGELPKTLNAFGWTKLVVSAFLIIVAPILVFAALRVFYRLTTWLDDSLQIWLGKRLPKGFYAWVSMKLKGLSAREYVEETLKRKEQVQQFSVRHQIVYKYLLKALKAFDRFEKFQEIAYPYLGAVIAAFITVILFLRVLRPYIR